MLPETDLPPSLTPSQRRGLEHADALDFLVYGHDEHAGRCLHAARGGEPCSREYATYPPPQEDSMRTGVVPPSPESWYVGTGIGALYGLGLETAGSAFARAVVDEAGELGMENVVMSRSFAPALAGWNVQEPRVREAV